MEPRAYKDKKGRVLFVLQSEGGSRPWGIHYHHPKTGVLCYLVTKDLPWVQSQEEAQDSLDAYAILKELEAAEPPQESPPDSPETAGPTDSPTGQGSDPKEGPVSGPSSPDNREKAREGQLTLARESLEKCWRERFSIQERKRTADASFTAQLKDVDEKVRDLLESIDRVDDWTPPPQELPFEDPEPPAPPEEARCSCGHFHSQGDDDGGPGPCKEEGCHCPDWREPSKPLTDHSGNCFACGHGAAAHLTEAGDWRPCVVAGCGCVAREQAGEDQTQDEEGAA